MSCVWTKLWVLDHPKCFCLIKGRRSDGFFASLVAPNGEGKFKFIWEGACYNCLHSATPHFSCLCIHHLCTIFFTKLYKYQKTTKFCFHTYLNTSILIGINKNTIAYEIHVKTFNNNFLLFGVTIIPRLCNVPVLCLYGNKFWWSRYVVVCVIVNMYTFEIIRLNWYTGLIKVSTLYCPFVYMYINK